MTRKDYVLIAEALKITYVCIPGASEFYFTEQCHVMASHLQSDNPRFNRSTFLAACGV